jgi:hypothetical protein
MQLYEVNLDGSMGQEKIYKHDISNNKLGNAINYSNLTYCPMSNKQEMNPPSINFIDIVNNTAIFLSRKNIIHLTKYIISLNVDQDTNYNLELLKNDLPSIMKKWTISENLDDYEYLYDNPLTVLSYINKHFLNTHGYLYQKNVVKNVYRMDGATTDKEGNKLFKKYSEMTADEYKNINVWKPTDLFTDNSKKRYNNKVTPWEVGLYTRHYDRDNDGLQQSSYERASLDNQIHGYDMSNIIKGSTFYENHYFDNI